MSKDLQAFLDESKKEVEEITEKINKLVKEFEANKQGYEQAQSQIQNNAKQLADLKLKAEGRVEAYSKALGKIKEEKK